MSNYNEQLNAINAKLSETLSNLNELEDNPQSLLNLYVGMEYLNSDDIDARFKKINQVTKEDVVKLASKIHLDTIYLLSFVTPVMVM